MMLAHYHGQIWNASEFARSFGVADTTIRHYLDVLTSALVVPYGAIGMAAGTALSEAVSLAIAIRVMTKVGYPILPVEQTPSVAR